MQQSHKNFWDIKYHSMKLQDYMSAPNMNSEDIELLFALKTKTMRGIISDFGKMYTSDQCKLCELRPHKDTIEELIISRSLKHIIWNGAEYQDIFSTSVDKQVKATKQFRTLITEIEIQLAKLKVPQDNL